MKIDITCQGQIVCESLITLSVRETCEGQGRVGVRVQCRTQNEDD